MSLACITYQTALEELLVQYNEHQTRLKSWIEELTERASDLLLADEIQIESDGSGIKQSRSSGGLQVAARHFFTTAMQLSKEQLMAAVRLARLDIFKQPGADEASRKPCAPDCETATSAAAASVAETAVNGDHSKGCVESSVDKASPATKQNTPVRATKHPQPESLVDILARETEAALAGLTGEMVNESIREHRRQRAKELKLARHR